MTQTKTQVSCECARKAHVRYVTALRDVPDLPDDQRQRLEEVARVFPFRATDYYLSLIDWKDPDDPIRQIIVPRVEELNHWGRLDASNEAANTKSKGVQHKYPDTVLLLCNEVCGGFCRYCFRKRLFIERGRETTTDVSQGLKYIAEHPEVTNVLLTGGDPLLLSTRKIEQILAGLREIPHVQIIRIGSKMPAFDPWRILGDEELLRVLSTHSTPQRRIYMMTHFDHPRELTDAAIDGLDRLIRCGVILANQCPLIKGVNDDPQVLSDLYRRLSWVGCPPYYLFQGRPVAGNEPYEVPIVRGWHIFRETLRHGSGLARRARFVMSHETGKIEIAGVDERHIYLRYQRAKDPALRGQFLVYKRNDQAYWLDQLEPGAEGDAPRFATSSVFETEEGPE